MLSCYKKMHLLTREAPTHNLCEHKSSWNWIKRINLYLSRPFMYPVYMQPTKFHNFQTKPVAFEIIEPMWDTLGTWYVRHTYPMYIIQLLLVFKTRAFEKYGELVNISQFQTSLDFFVNWLLYCDLWLAEKRNSNVKK